MISNYPSLQLYTNSIITVIFTKWYHVYQIILVCNCIQILSLLLSLLNDIMSIKLSLFATVYK